MYPHTYKRAFDIALSVTLIVITLPLVIFLGLLIKLDSRGPVLFIQERTGLNGTTFRMYKLRTMAKSNDVRDASQQNLVTNVGKVARALSLDELPQMINILKGEMSFIGPRPWIPEYYTHLTPKQRKRVSVLPGITGLAQAHGRNSLSIHQKLQYDLDYVKRISAREDAKITFLTIKALIIRSSHQLEKHGIHSELTILQHQQMSKNQPVFREKL